MKLEEYLEIMRVGTPSDKAVAVVKASSDPEMTDDDFHQLTALLKGAARPRVKMTADESKLWAEVSRVNLKLKNLSREIKASVAVLPKSLQEDAVRAFSDTLTLLRGTLADIQNETGEP